MVFAVHKSRLRLSAHRFHAIMLKLSHASMTPQVTGCFGGEEDAICTGTMCRRIRDTAQDDPSLLATASPRPGEIRAPESRKGPARWAVGNSRRTSKL